MTAGSGIADILLIEDVLELVLDVLSGMTGPSRSMLYSAENWLDEAVDELPPLPQRVAERGDPVPTFGFYV